MGLSSVLAASAIARPGVCTSSTQPASPYEGQVIYETDTDLLRIWNGSAWRTLAFGTATNGPIIQVVQATYGTMVSSSSTTFADTGLTASITPKSTSNKILVSVHQNGCWKSSGNAGSAVGVRLYRDSTGIVDFAVDSGYTGTALEVLLGSEAVIYLDSPNTTSSVTYKTQFKNRVAAAAVQVQTNNVMSTITLMEIVA